MKKFLSMVLAMVMTLSLVTVSAGAKEFPDNDQLTGDADGVYAEAVNVLSEMGIIDGDTDGNFKPKGTLTRGAASKIIACMRLGKTTAESLGTAAAPFKDVPVGSTFAGYIAYCVEQGIINGYADGTFRPSGALTGYAFQKMLLTALGYDSAIEGYANNPNWRVNVAGRAQQEGLLKGLDASSYNASEAATREQACLMALNTIKTPLVEYENKGSTLTVNGATISQSASAVKYVTTVDRSRATAIDDKQYQTTATGTDNSYFVEFGEQYQPDLRRVRTSDDFERPAYTWTWQKDEVGTYVNYDILLGEYNTGVTGRALRELIGQTAIDTSTLSYYVDGVKYDANLAKKIDHVDLLGISKSDLVRGNDTDAGMTKNGVLTQVFLDRDHGTPWTLTITSIDTWLAKANADYNKTSEELSVTAYTEKKGTDQTASKNLKIDVEDVPAIESVKKDDFILVQRSGKDSDVNNTTVPTLRVVDIADPEILSDSTVTQFSKGEASGRAIDKLTTGGTEYNYSQKCYYDAEALEDYDMSLLTNMTYDVYLDTYGYVIGVSIHEGNRNFVFVTGYSYQNQGQSTIVNRTATATAIFMDGSMQDITVNSKDTNTNLDTYNNKATVRQKKDASGNDVNYPNYYPREWSRNGESQHNRWYSYTVSAAGVYTLKPVERTLASEYNDDTTLNSANLSLLADAQDTVTSDYLYTPKTSGGSSRAYGNDSSVYITAAAKATVRDGKLVISDVNGVYTGIQGTKMTVNGWECPEVYAIYDSDNYIIAAIVIGDAQGSIENYVYVCSEAKSEKYEDGYYYWTFEAIQNAEKKTYTVRSKYTEGIKNLRPYHMQQLLFDGDYVSKVLNIVSPNLTDSQYHGHEGTNGANAKFYVDPTINMEESNAKDYVDIYDVGHTSVNYDDTYRYITMNPCTGTLYGFGSVTNNTDGTRVYNPTTYSGKRIDSTILFEGNTLYLTDDDNTGLAVRPSAKAVVIQQFNGDEVTWEFSSVREAIDNMRDARDTQSGMQFRGRIVAPLRDGVAQWVIFISDTQLRTADKRGDSSGGSDNRTQDVKLDNLLVKLFFENSNAVNGDATVRMTASNDLTIEIPVKKGYDWNQTKTPETLVVRVNGVDCTNNFSSTKNETTLVLRSSGLDLRGNETVTVTVRDLKVPETAKPGTYTVTFDYGNGTKTTTTKYKETEAGKGIEITLPQAPTAPDDTKQFDCWKVTDKNGVVTYVNAGGKYTVMGETTVTAVWNDVIKSADGKVTSLLENKEAIENVLDVTKASINPNDEIYIPLKDKENVAHKDAVISVSYKYNNANIKLLAEIKNGDLVISGIDKTDKSYTDLSAEERALVDALFAKDLAADNISITIGEPILPNLKVEACVDTDKLLGSEKASDLQTNVRVDGLKVTGTSKYVADYTAFSSIPAEQSGNYIALKLTDETSKAGKAITVVSSDGERTVTLGSDGILIWKITPQANNASKTDQKITVKVGETPFEIDLTALTLGTQSVTPPADKFTVTFNLGYAGATGTPEPQSVESGKTATAPAAPARAGYTFAGWFAPGAETAFDFTTPITAAITLTAKWNEEKAAAEGGKIVLDTSKDSTADPTKGIDVTTATIKNDATTNKTVVTLPVDSSVATAERVTEPTVYYTFTSGGKTYKVKLSKTAASDNATALVYGIDAATAEIVEVNADGTTKEVPASEKAAAIAAAETQLPVDAAANEAVITVAPPEVTGITLNKTTLSLTVGDKETLTATLAPVGAVGTIAWSSSDATKASVDTTTGEVNAVAAGPAVITATCGDKKATCTVTVTATPVEETPITSVEVALAAIADGGKLPTTATVKATPADSATFKSIAWTEKGKSDAVTDAAAGKTYVATITLEPEATHQFVAAAAAKAAATTFTVKVDDVAVDAAKVTSEINSDGNAVLTVEVEVPAAPVAKPTFSISTADAAALLGGKGASDMITGTVTGLTPDANNKLTLTGGTLKYVTGYTQFNGSDATEQQGYFLPLTIVLPDGKAADAVTKVVVTGGKEKTWTGADVATGFFNETPTGGTANTQATLVQCLNTKSSFTVAITLDGTETVYTIDASGLIPTADYTAETPVIDTRTNWHKATVGALFTEGDVNYATANARAGVAITTGSFEQRGEIVKVGFDFDKTKTAALKKDATEQADKDAFGALVQEVEGSNYLFAGIMIPVPAKQGATLTAAKVDGTDEFSEHVITEGGKQYLMQYYAIGTVESDGSITVRENASFAPQTIEFVYGAESYTVHLFVTRTAK